MIRLLFVATKKMVSQLVTFFKYHKFLHGLFTIIKSTTINGISVSIGAKCYVQNSYLYSYISISDNCFLTNVQLKGNNKVGKNSSISNTFLDSYSYISDLAKANNLYIGKFCSIGPNFQSGYGTHPLTRISTSSYFYTSSNNKVLSDSEISSFQEYKTTTIGNDVWIGANVVLIDGVTIGNGAVLAAGCVVTKDVPPYAIFGGIPAKLIRYRFEPDIIKLLEEFSWWEKDINWINSHISLFQKEEIDFDFLKTSLNL